MKIISFAFFLLTTISIIFLNAYYGGNLKLPVYSDHWGIVHYPLEITGSDFIESLKWEHTGVPGFRIIIYIIEIISKFTKIDANYLYYVISLTLYIFVSSKLLLSLSSKYSKFIFFIFIASTPFYFLTAIWPFHSGIVVIIIFYASVVLFNKNHSPLLRLNIFILLMSCASLFWPLFNGTSIAFIFIFAIINTAYFNGISILKSRWKYFLIGLFATLLANLIPIKNYYVYGWYTPTSLAGFAKFNTIWPWVTEEKRLSLYNAGILNDYSYQFMARDFNGGENPLFLKNKELYNIFIHYKNLKNLKWSINENWEYVNDDGTKNEFLNALFHDPKYIEKREPVAVALFSYFNNIGNNIYPIYFKDPELRQAMLNSIHERVVVPHTAPELYYKFYPIFGTWGDAKMLSNFPSLDFYLIDREIGSTLSFLSIFVTVFSVLSLLTYLILKNIQNYNFGVKLLIYTSILSSLFIKFKMVMLALIFVFLYCAYLYLIRKFTNPNLISRTGVNQVLIVTLLQFFLLLLIGIFYSTMFEGMRYYGIILIIPISSLMLLIEEMRE